MVERTVKKKSEVGEDEETGQMVGNGGEEGQANSGWGRMEDTGKWRMKKGDKMEEENKERLDGRWWRKRMEGRRRRDEEREGEGYG